MTTSVARIPTALEAAETRYLAIRTKYAAAQAEISDAKRRRDVLKPEADAALVELHTLRAQAEQERLLGAVALELTHEIEGARLEVERCDAQYTEASDAFVAATRGAQHSAVQFGPDGSIMVNRASRRVENADAVLAASRVVLEVADNELTVARVRLLGLEAELERRLRAANERQANTDFKAREKGILDRLRGRARVESRNGH